MIKSTGTLTFLFSDIQGSTNLLHTLGYDYSIVLDTHHKIIRESIDKYGGNEIDTAGDGFFISFNGAKEAVSAAVEIQKKLFSVKWKDDINVKVRMGLHTGEAKIGPNGFVGMDVHLASRIMSAGHGGQILISSTTKALVVNELSEGISIKDLGEHHLKDIPRPENFFQIQIDGLPSEFLPLKTISFFKNNIPEIRSKLIGREFEVENIKELLLRKATRLVTLTGPGGIGKTILGVEICSEIITDFKDGVYIVYLTSLNDFELVLPGILKVLGIPEDPSISTLERLKQYLLDKKMLLFLDNFEHVMEASSQIKELLNFCPSVKILITSRFVLKITEETEYPVNSLILPESESLDDIKKCSSVILFLTKAKDSNKNFAATDKNIKFIGEICKELDGIPLAIELAASRLRLFSPEKLLERLSKKLDFLKTDKKDLHRRHQTLRETIAWSYELLNEKEKKLLLLMSVFRGGANFEAVESICHSVYGSEIDVIETMEELINKSFMKTLEGFDGDLRFFILETIREFVEECLNESNYSESIKNEYRKYLLSFAENAYTNFIGPDSDNWFKLVEIEIDNLRSALELAKKANDMEYCLKLSNYLSRFWLLRGLLLEGLTNAKKILNIDSSKDYPEFRARLLYDAGAFSQDMSFFEEAKNYFEESHEIFSDLKDDAFLARVKSGLGLLMINTFEYEKGKQLCLEAKALYKEIGNKRGESNSLSYLSYIFIEQGDYLEAKDILNEVIFLRSEIGQDRDFAYAASHLATIETKTGNFEKAKEHLDSAMSILTKAGDKQFISDIYIGYFDLYHTQGDYEKADKMLSKAREVISDSGIEKKDMNIDFLSGHLSFDKENYEEAYDIQTKNLSLLNKIELSADIYNMKFAGEVFIQKKEFDKAKESLKICLKIIKRTGAKYSLVQCLELLSLLSYIENKHERSAKLINYAGILRKKNNYFVCACESKRFEKLYKLLNDNFQNVLESELTVVDLNKCIEYAVEDL